MKYINTQHLFLSLMLITMFSCKETTQESYTTATDLEQSEFSKTREHPGKKLMENKCYVCHNPNSEMKGRIAPPMVAVKSHYMTDGISKEDFANAIWDFVEKPNPYKTKMKGAVNRFGLMPYQEFKEEEIRQIAVYMYDHNIDEPQ